MTMSINLWFYSGSCLMRSLWNRVKLIIITDWWLHANELKSILGIKQFFGINLIILYGNNMILICRLLNRENMLSKCFFLWLGTGSKTHLKRFWGDRQTCSQIGKKICLSNNNYLLPFLYLRLFPLFNRHRLKERRFKKRES